MKKELTMEMRLLLAFVLMGLVLFITPYIYKAPPPAPTQTKQAATKSEAEKAAEAVKPPQTASSPAAGTQAGQIQAGQSQAAQIQADKQETVVVDTDLYHVVFSNQGAVVKSWVLKSFKDRAGKPLELVNQLSLGKVPAPFALVFKGQAPAVDPNMALFKVEQSPDKLNLDFQFSDGRGLIKKTFQFAKDSYLVQVTSEVTENGVLLPHSLAWRGGFGD